MVLGNSPIGLRPTQSKIRYDADNNDDKLQNNDASITVFIPSYIIMMQGKSYWYLLDVGEGEVLGVTDGMCIDGSRNRRKNK